MKMIVCEQWMNVDLKCFLVICFKKRRDVHAYLKWYQYRCVGLSLCRTLWLVLAFHRHHHHHLHWKLMIRRRPAWLLSSQPSLSLELNVLLVSIYIALFCSLKGRVANWHFKMPNKSNLELQRNLAIKNFCMAVWHFLAWFFESCI